MTPLEALEALAKAQGDQAIAHMRSRIEDLKRIVSTDPSEWTPDDHNTIRGTLASVVGLIYAGRI